MTYRGVIRNGKIEVEPPHDLPEGAVVRVELEVEQWGKRVKELAERVAKATPPGVSAVDELIRSRR